VADSTGETSIEESKKFFLKLRSSNTKNIDHSREITILFGVTVHALAIPPASTHKEILHEGALA
jgi:hypothetical protein